jgi:hypothetical protein
MVWTPNDLASVTESSAERESAYTTRETSEYSTCPIANHRRVDSSGRLRRREQFVAENPFEADSRFDFAEDVIGMVDYVDSAAVIEPLQRRAALQHEELDSGLAARENEDQTNPPCSYLLQLQSEIIGKADAKTTGHVTKLGFKCE